MKLKSISVLLILACSSLLGSPRKFPCPEREATTARIEKPATEAAAMTDDAVFLPMHHFSTTVL